MNGKLKRQQKLSCSLSYLNKTTTVKKKVTDKTAPNSSAEEQPRLLVTKAV
jgi:hypothetical protein